MVERNRLIVPHKKTEFKKGHKKHKGRPPGVGNKITMTLKEAILTAIQLQGSDKKGKDGLVGWFRMICREDIALMVRLVEKILPTQITGKDGGPVQVFHIPDTALKGLNESELSNLEQILAKIGSGLVSDSTPKQGDADSYAASLGMTKH